MPTIPTSHVDARLAALHATGLLDAPPDPAFDRVTSLVSAVLRVPFAAVALIDADRQWTTSCAGASAPAASARETPLSHSICQVVVATGAPLVVADARTDPGLRDHPAVVESGVVAYLGVPLATEDGFVLGSLCAVDLVPRAWTSHDVTTLTHLAGVVMTEVAFRAEVDRRRHAETAARASEERFRALSDGAPVGIFQSDCTARVTYVNARAQQLWARDEARMLGHGWLDGVHADDAPSLLQGWSAALAAGTEYAHAFRIVAADGTVRHVRGQAAPLRNADGVVVGSVGTVEDVSARHAAEAALAASERRFRTVVESIDQGLFITDREHRILYANRRAAEITGHPVDELVGRVGFELLLPEAERPAFVARMARRMEGAAERYELEIVRRDGTRVWTETGGTPFRDADGAIVGTIGVVADVSARKALEAELVSQARRDALTGLANRTQFSADVSNALAQPGAAAPGPDGEVAPVSVLFLDLDDFKAVNDGHGHAAGDALLVAVAERLLSATRGSDTVARLGGDEFAVLLSPTRLGDDVAVVVPRMLQALARPVLVAGREVRVSASIGVARATPGVGADDLLRHADVAMYRAKARGKNRHAVFSAAEDAAALDRSTLQTELAGAHERGEMTLAYQPVVDLTTGRPVGAEALARWQHPVRGAVPPDVFIPLAESTGLMPALGRWVLRTACAEAAHWPRDPNGCLPRLAVNVSGRQLDDATFLEDVIAILRETAYPAERLTLEVTETVLLTNPRVTRARLEAVRALGVQVACDDFGTGYSSLTAVRQLPLDSLKIDKAFTRGLVGDPTQRALTEAVIQLARALGLRTVAEGVETMAERDILLALGCPLGQGYLYARPLAPDAAREFFRRPGTPGGAAVDAAGATTTIASSAAHTEVGESRAAGPTVLVVDDDHALRSVITRTLETAGYRVLTAADGADALRALAAEAGGVRVVVADVVMPELCGYALADLVGARYPGTRVLLMSGYDPVTLAGSGLRAARPTAAAVPVLSKPVATAALLAALDALGCHGSPSPARDASQDRVASAKPV